MLNVGIPFRSLYIYTRVSVRRFEIFFNPSLLVITLIFLPCCLTTLIHNKKFVNNIYIWLIDIYMLVILFLLPLMMPALFLLLSPSSTYIPLLNWNQRIINVLNLLRIDNLWFLSLWLDCCPQSKNFMYRLFWSSQVGFEKNARYFKFLKQTICAIK